MDSYLKLIAVPHKLKQGNQDTKLLFLPELKRILFKIYRVEIEDIELTEIESLLDQKIFEIKDEQFRKKFVPKFIDDCIRKAILKFDLK
jgi:hypothetical protein